VLKHGRLVLLAQPEILPNEPAEEVDKTVLDCQAVFSSARCEKIIKKPQARHR
jgi:hypothetical protein